MHSVQLGTLQRLGTMAVSEMNVVPLNGPPMSCPALVDSNQRGLFCRGPPHRRVALFFLAELANWLPKVIISPHLLAVYSKRPVVRTDTMISRLVSVYTNGVTFGER